MLRDTQHLFRMAGLFVVGIVVFLLLRAWLVPADFGVYGHFRAGAMADNMAQPTVFAGHAACEGCHDDVAEERRGGKHEGVGCESCHWALAAHADDPLEVKPELPETVGLCQRCHQQMASRPDWFPQVDAQEHADGDPCTDCHAPHSPSLDL